MGFYRWVVEHPVTVLMVTVAVFVFGWVSFGQLPLDLMPDISYPTLTVRTAYGGAAPEEVEAQVSRPVEEALSTVEGVVSIESRSRAGLSDVVLEFDWDTPMGAAMQDVRERLQTTWLPDGIERPLILRYDPSLQPILRVALTGGGSQLQQREVAEKEVKRRLEALDGVAAVSVRGGLERLVLVEPREDWLVARGVSLDQVRATLSAENVNVAGGLVREGENEYLIRTLNEFRSIDDVRELQVVRPDGARVRIGDVADVSEGHADREVVARLDGVEAVEIEVYKEADANLVQVARQVKAALSLEGEGRLLPEGMEARVLDDQAHFVEGALDNLTGDGILGGLLAILVTFVFLRDWVTTAIISTAIPICLFATFGVMYVGDLSLNLMSLGGLALGVSMVIDSGTVVLESVQNHIDAGKSRKEAAIAGTAEVATAVFASVLTAIAVFLPIVFVEGVAGQIFGDLALTVVFSLLASLGVALIVIPMLAARQLTLQLPPARARDIAASTPRDAWATMRQRRAFWRWPWALVRFVTHGILASFAVMFAVLAGWATRLGLRVLFVVLGTLNRGTVWLADRFLDQYAVAEAAFARLLDRWLHRPTRVLVVAIAGTLAAAIAFADVGAQLIPDVHQGRFTVELAMPVGTPLARTEALVQQLEARLRQLDGVGAVYAVVGTERRADAKPDEGENTARVLVELAPGGDLERREDAAMAAIRRELEAFPRMRSRFARPALFSFHTPVEVVLYDSELSTLRAASELGLAALGAVPQLREVHSSMTAGYPEVRVRYDRQRLAALGIGVGDVARAVRAKIQGERPTRIADGERRIDLLVRLQERDRNSVEALGAINVNPALTPEVRLDTVATVEEGEGPSEVRRIDQRRAVVLSADVAGFDLAGAAKAAESALRGAGLPAGMEIEVAGQNRELETSLRSLALALALAIFLVYVIMASTFESLRDPLVILFSVPLALVGVSAGLWLTGTPVSVVVFIGLIVLAGVVVANAIVLVDAIARLRKEGRPLDDAIRAAAALRLRPILITALNSVLGLVPLALGFGQGQEMQRPLAITIIFGLASSTFLTLVVVPVIYRLAVRVTEGGGGPVQSPGTA
ncbi:MAG: efflux RND transporter permease subunit [Myxococcales bacterium]|nr:efflux RND transporter permease subunit [Myxococcales bacterium]